MAQQLDNGDASAQGEIPTARRNFIFPDGSQLGFKAALPENLDWTETGDVVTDFDRSGLFTHFQKAWIGKYPINHGPLEISIYRAEIIPERVAIAGDYARLFASVWGPENFGVTSPDLDFGEVMTGSADKRVRISVWRRGTELLILRGETTTDQLPMAEKVMDKLVQSLSFNDPLQDPVIADLRLTAITLPSGAELPFRLPAHWKAWDQSDAEAKPISASVFLDRADEGGNSALGVFGITIPEGASAANAPLRDIATGASDLMFENLLPGASYDRQEMNTMPMQGFDAVTKANALYLDKIIPKDKDSRPLGSTAFFAAGSKDVFGFAAISAYPSGQEAMGLMMHANFVQRVVIDDLRDYATKVQD